MEAEQQYRDEWPSGAHVFCGMNKVPYGCVFSPSSITSVTTNPGHQYEDYEEENWKKMGAALSESSALTKLVLRDLPKKATAILFGGGIKNYSWPSLKVLELEGNLGVAGMRTVCSALKSSSRLYKLHLCGTKLGARVMKLLVDVLNHTRIDDLCLYSGPKRHRPVTYTDIRFNDKEVEKLLTAQNTQHLVRLSVVGVELTARGYESIFRFLRREDTSLKGLDIPVNTTHFAKLLISSIPRQSKLEQINLNATVIDRGVEDAVLDLVCNTSGFEALNNSNHRLCQVGYHPGASFLDNSVRAKKLATALEINAQVNFGAPISCAIRSKVRHFYFENPDFDVSVFNNMDIALMPHVLELVTKIELKEDKATRHRRRGLPLNFVCSDKIDGIYRLLKNCHVSELFSFPSPEAQLRQKDVQLRRKDAVIQQLEVANADLEAEVESMKQKLDQIIAEKEELGHAGSLLPNKRTRTNNIVKSSKRPGL